MGHMIELKAGRKQSSSMLTLFSKSPLPAGINPKLWDRYGYPRKNHKVLYTRIHPTKFQTLNGKPGFKLNITTDRAEIVHYKPDKTMEVPYWDKNRLMERFEQKGIECVLYVKADSIGQGKNEKFHYNEAYLLSGFSPKKFMKLLKSDDYIHVEMRMGHHANGKCRDRGTAFRIKTNKLQLCFTTSKRVL